MNQEIIRNFSAILVQCNPFARIYCHTYEILSNHEGSNTNSEDRSNNDDYAKSGSPITIISPSTRLRLTERGDRRIHNLPTMEEVIAAIPIGYSDRSFRGTDLFLRGSNRSRGDSLHQRYDFV
ncbi:hypothetical protein RMATCC62417_11971 [Rhizopus microsporus]|nr:hypothetical protein RMATCC62417_11971 [Rhizopus microsporus]